MSRTSQGEGGVGRRTHILGSRLCTEMEAGGSFFFFFGKTNTPEKKRKKVHTYLFGFWRAWALVTGLISGPRELLINLRLMALYLIREVSKWTLDQNPFAFQTNLPFFVWQLLRVCPLLTGKKKREKKTAGKAQLLFTPIAGALFLVTVGGGARGGDGYVKKNKGEWVRGGGRGWGARKCTF